MSSNSTGTALKGEPFTLRINATKPSVGGTNFYLSLQAGWADNDYFTFTPESIQDNSGEDLNPANFIITHDFNFTPESSGNYTIRAWCATSAASQFIDIQINVTDIPDITAPIVDSPSDIEYDVLTTGHRIIWTPYDERPSMFTLQLNGVIILSGSWSGQPIMINIDYLSPGTYEYNLTVIDVGGNTASDVVIVTVTGELPITTTTPTTDTTTTPITATGGNPIPPNDNNEELTTTSFGYIMVAMIGIVGILSFLLILERWRS